MKWKKHKIGDRRMVRRFAWLPTECYNSSGTGNTFMVWLEFYKEAQILGVDYHTDRATWGHLKSFIMRDKKDENK